MRRDPESCLKSAQELIEAGANLSVVANEDTTLMEYQ